MKVGIFFVILILCTWAFFEIADDFNRREIKHFDHTIINFIQSYVSSRMTVLMLMITFLGSVNGIAIITVITILILWLIRHRVLSIYVGCSVVLGAGAFNAVLKSIFKRERPDIMRVVQETGYSFPSGHSMGSMILYGTLVFTLFKLCKHQWINHVVMIAAGFIILSIGVSRIYLGVHYPSDVIGGYIAGLMWVLITSRLFMFIEKRFPLHKKFVKSGQDI
ncbi:phosphatase PAP2 family protein [Bacillus ginsengihumi]|uniref:Phosphatase PAP2 family protein n=3 Tax=Heyndrickxia ginsengihumi TaxID=363870 RepID=A0A6M0P566_9BACI|nr:phosphatase PAP2 family protein [Bacillus sp. (in: firmicutes)]NEY19854.1 phosphatase PAP2 family protein [Heyndrickxia ginsengihumi]